MSAALTRRALVQGAGAALAGVGIPMAAEAGIPVSDPDAGLFDLIARHAEAGTEMLRAWRAFEDTSAAFNLAAPPQPDALVWRPGDFPRQGFAPHLCDRDGDAAPRHYGPRAAGWLRKHEPFPAWARRVGAALSEEEAEACEARRLEILAAWDRWQADRRDVEVCTGYAAACEASDAASSLVVDLAAEIAASRPRTLPGLRAFGAWFAGQVAADDLHDDFLEQLADAVAGFGGVMS